MNLSRGHTTSLLFVTSHAPYGKDLSELLCIYCSGGSLMEGSGMARGVEGSL